MDLLNYGFSNFEIVNVSEHETKKFNNDNAGLFQTENDIFGSSKPILSLNKDSYLILPKTADFEDIQSDISYDAAGEGQLAVMDYHHNGVYVGSASVDVASNTSSYDFDTLAEPLPEPEETEEENIIFVNVTKVLLCILAGAGILILVFLIKSVIQNYSFAGGHRYRIRYNKRTKYKLKRRRDSQPPRYDDFD